MHGQKNIKLYTYNKLFTRCSNRPDIHNNGRLEIDEVGKNDLCVYCLLPCVCVCVCLFVCLLSAVMKRFRCLVCQLSTCEDPSCRHAITPRDFRYSFLTTKETLKNGRSVESGVGFMEKS
jgi:hypothetical protein